MVDRIPPKSPQPPPVFDGTPLTIVDEAKRLAEATTELWESIGRTITVETVTVENFVDPILLDENELHARRQILCFYASISSSRDLRGASNQVSDILAGAEIDRYLRQDVFRLADALLKRQKSNEIHIEPETLRFLEQFHHLFLQNGCGIPDASVRESFRAGLKQLHVYQKQFLQNLRDDQAGLWLSKEELRGLPDDFFHRVKVGQGENEGHFWVPVSISYVNQVLKYANNDYTRRRVFTLQQNRLNDENIPLHRNIVLLRDRLARQVGYANHAAWKCQERMINDPVRIRSFLTDIERPLGVLGRKAVERLLEVNRKAEPEADKLYYWDHAYHQRLLDEQESAVNFSDVSEYFELHQTLKGLLDIYSHLFEISFEQITPDGAAEILGNKASYLKPHEDFLAYSVFSRADTTNGLLGYLYFDFHPRPGKYNHAGHYFLQPGYTRRDSTRYVPSSAIIMNYPPPTEAKPTILTMDQVRSLFHEIGHSMHNLLSVTKCARFHGTRVERDFVEAPSMMFEYFFWTALHIKEVSHHYSYLSPAFAETWKSGHPDAVDLPARQLPDETVDKLLQLKHANNPLSLLRNLHYATYDMIVHTPSSHEELAAMNLCEVFNKTRNDIMGLHGGEALGEGWEWAHFESLFRHINGGSYDVGYYAYVMGRIWALDIFDSTFKDNTTNREAGRRYRNMVLKPGGSQPAMVTLRKFLGREPRPNAFYDWIGVPQPGKEGKT